ncbi:hypothetical protein BK671_01490 [Pseudomonas fluorescens]|uniref:Uncharacterized protein n=1 Tax=Pseudomonas fluorescens TaxID=294 RepID=A0A423LW60_PSEFL|nr:hypothetical protein BK671_01490 [Pseudomonas fluorescens]
MTWILPGARLKWLRSCWYEPFEGDAVPPTGIDQLGIFIDQAAVNREQAHSYRGTHSNCRSEPARDDAGSDNIYLAGKDDFPYPTLAPIPHVS